MRQYMVWASQVQKYEDWCPVYALLKLKKAGSEKHTLQGTFNMMSHGLYEGLYAEKWGALRDKRKVSAAELEQMVVSEIGGIVKRNWDHAIYPALRDEKNEMSFSEYIEAFEKKFCTNRFRQVCKNVAHAIEFRGKNKYNFVMECQDWDLLKNSEKGVGARPDFFLSMGNIMMVMDVKSRFTNGAFLQNVIGYIVLEKNKKLIAEKLGLNPKKATASRHTLFEVYSSGEEVGAYIEDKNVERALEIANKLRTGEIPDKKQVCSPNKERACGLCQVCNKEYGSIEELLKR